MVEKKNTEAIQVNSLAHAVKLSIVFKLFLLEIVHFQRSLISCLTLLIGNFEGMIVQVTPRLCYGSSLNMTSHVTSFQLTISTYCRPPSSTEITTDVHSDQLVNRKLFILCHCYRMW